MQDSGSVKTKRTEVKGSMRKRLFVVTLSFIFLIQFTTPAYSQWVDNWLDQQTHVAPNFFEGQKRGYLSGGSFSARIQTRNDHLFTVMPPKIRAGCGGIDAFMGGISFLNFEYIVQKFQNMIQAAPAIAFDIALRTLSESLGISVKSFEKIMNALNQVALDECKAGQAMVATLMHPLVKHQLPQERATAVADFKQSTGIDNFWRSITETTRAANDTAAASAIPAGEMMRGCPPDIRAIFGTTGSVIKAATTKFGMGGYANIIRGLLGDIIIHEEAGLPHATKLAACPQGDDTGMKALLTGTFNEQTEDGVCRPITDTNNNLTRWATDKMVTIAWTMRNRGNLNPSQTAFLEMSPLNSYIILKTAVEAGTEVTIINNLAEVTAKAYAFEILNSIYNTALTITSLLEELGSKQSGAKVDSPAYLCKTGMTGAVHEIEKFSVRVEGRIAGLRELYAKKLVELNNINEFTANKRAVREIIAESLMGKFGQQVARGII